MIKILKAVFVLFAIIMSAGGTSAVFAQNARAEQKAREIVRTVGTGNKARVEGKLADRTLFKGTVVSDSNDSFTIADAKTGSTRIISYSDVDEIKVPRSGLKPRTWIIIGAAAAAGVIIARTVLYPVLCDGGAGC